MKPEKYINYVENFSCQEEVIDSIINQPKRIKYKLQKLPNGCITIENKKPHKYSGYLNFIKDGIQYRIHVLLFVMKLKEEGRLLK